LAHLDEDITLENILKLMHNSALRIAEFFEEFIKCNPSKTDTSLKSGSDLVIERVKCSGAVHYTLQRKDGCSIIVNMTANPVQTLYKITYLDNDSEEKRAAEALVFETCLKNQGFCRDEFTLKNQQAHSLSPAEISESRHKVDPADQATNQISLEDLSLSAKTEYIRSLYEALDQKL
jgi:hypothetical protein